jgi:hypothetical protein
MRGYEFGLRMAQVPLQRQAMQLGVAGRLIEMQEAKLKLDEVKKELASWEKDLPNVSKWRSLTPEQRQSIPAPVVDSFKGISIVDQTMKADALRRYQKLQEDSKVQQINRVSDYMEEVQKLPADLQKGLELHPNAIVPTDTQRSILATNKLLAKTQAENALLALDTEEREKGNVPQKSVSSKGAVSTKYVVPKDAVDEPVVEVMYGGRKYIRVGNNNPIPITALSEADKAEYFMAQRDLVAAQGKKTKLTEFGTDEEKREAQVEVDNAKAAIRAIFNKPEVQSIPTQPNAGGAVQEYIYTPETGLTPRQ